MDKPAWKTRLPDVIYNTYRQYKYNCHLINRWVYMTALNLRETVHAQEPKPSAQTYKRKGGKAKNTTGTHSQSMASQDPDLAFPKLTFRVFINLVREIASSGVAISQAYLALLSTTIKQRKLAAAFYSPDADAWRDNLSHKKAIEVYEEALAILSDAAKKHDQRDNESFDLTNSKVVTSGENIFALAEEMRQLALAVEEEGLSELGSVGEASPEQNEWLRDNPLVNRTGKTRHKHNAKSFPLEAYELVMEDEPNASKTKKSKATFEEAFDALTCFLLDIDRLRKFCNSIWKSVEPVGTTTRLTASVVTNRAVQLVKQMEYDLVADFPTLRDLSASFQMLLDKTAEVMFGRLGDELYSVKEQMMYYTWETICKFGEVLDSNNVPIMRDGYFGYFDPKANRQKMTPFQKYTEDRCIMCNYWPDLVVLYRTHATFRGEQGLGKDFRPFVLEKNRPNSWALVFACQMHVDSVHIRRRYLEYDLQAMRTLASTLVREYDEFLSDDTLYDTNMDLVAIPSIRDSRIRVTEGLQRDIVGEIKIRNKWDELSKQACQKDSLWRMNPWLTANAMCDSIMDFFFSGVAVIGASGFVQSAIQLWNMLKQTGHMVSSDDTGRVVLQSESSISTKRHTLLFDHLVDVFGQNVFQGPPPKSQFAKRFDMMLGIRAEAFAKGKRQVKKKANVPELAHNEAGRGITALISDVFGQLYSKDYIPKSDSDLSKQAHSTHPLLSTLELVESEQGISLNKMTARGPLINMNFFKIHRLCVRLFKELDSAIGPDLEQIFKVVPLTPTQIQLPMLTSWIARTENRSDGVPDQRILTKAAEVVRKVIGSKETGFYLIDEESDESLIS